ncbi:hypothetical protein Tco_1164622, partial [Tanacetum coccineum]
MVGVTDSSLIKRCNFRILSKPCSSVSSGSNEVDRIVHLGNEIGFDMRDKDIVVADVLAQGEFKGLQESMSKNVDQFLIQSLWGNTPCGYAFKKSDGKSS